jgi:hypothetical protein
MVLFIEGNESSLACLEGTGSSCGLNGEATAGNWVSGTLYPMMLTVSPNNDSVDINYNLTYFPTIVMVCPNRTFVNLYPTSTGYLAVSPHQLDSAIKTCPCAGTNSLDAAIFNAGMPSPGMCGGSFTPTFMLQNYGTTTLTSCSVVVSLDGTVQSTTPWTGSLTQYATAAVTIPAMTINTGGIHYVKFDVTAPNGGTDQNLANDTITVPFTADMAPVTVPLVQGFESATFPPAGWVLNNPGAGNTYSWALAGVGGFGNSSQSAYIDFYNITAGNINEMMPPPVDLSSVINPIMTFSVAYEQYFASYVDSLDVLVSDDCGTTWKEVYNKYGTTLSTVGSSVTTNEFEPTSTQWRSDTVNLSAYTGQSKVFIKFRGISGYGNDCYVDDINIAQGVVGIKEIANPVNYMNVFPNPSSNRTNVEFSLLTSEKATFGVYDLIGNKILSIDETTYSAGSHMVIFNDNDLSQGVYFLKATIGDQKFTQKLTIVK